MAEKINLTDVIKFIKRLRTGETLQCPECSVGVIVPIGDYRTTKCFVCTECKFKINID